MIIYEYQIPNSIRSWKFLEYRIPNSIRSWNISEYRIPNSICSYKNFEYKIPNTIRSWKFTNTEYRIVFVTSKSTNTEYRIVLFGHNYSRIPNNQIIRCNSDSSRTEFSLISNLSTRPVFYLKKNFHSYKGRIWPDWSEPILDRT